MPLGLQTVVVTVDPPGNALPLSPVRAEYNQDLTAQFGVAADNERWSKGRKVSHTDLVDLLVAGLPADLRRPDLLILANALPDLFQHQAVACHLNHLTGGQALAFAVQGQGLGAPFTALRIAQAYTASGRCHTPWIAVLEQTTLPYHDPVVHDGAPLSDSGVLLSFDRGACPWQVRTVTEIAPGEKPAVRLPELLEGADRPLAVLGPWVERDLDLPVANHRVGTGGYATSVWLELGRHRDRWAEDHDLLLLCDTDPRTEVTHVALLDRLPTSS
ncbi:hypothetical protein ACGFZP_11155 [Kitasatospora sp. NPDC048239]|uniref:hypothetical protein n=1 Tax=Kitasatospora sp. NPDC048239 TaxID=3364046 RepID=UPI00371DFA2F